jgi:hypothetical protein
MPGSDARLMVCVVDKLVKMSNTIELSGERVLDGLWVRILE